LIQSSFKAAKVNGAETSDLLTFYGFHMAVVNSTGVQYTKIPAGAHLSK